MRRNEYKKMIGQAAIVALCVAVLIYVALIPSVTHMGSSNILNISVIYGVVTVLSLLMLLGYFVLIKNREKLFVLLFCAVLVVNCGYFLLSVSNTLGFALLANRISYFGAAFLPSIMLVIVADVCTLKYSKHAVHGLFAVSFLMFLLAASGGVLDVYYKEVSIEIIDGVTHLVKEYGPLHSVYSLYLFGCFGLMIAAIIYSFGVHRIKTYKQAAVICAFVFCNLAVWFVEQLINVDFEFLSVSYLATELFLVLFSLMMQDYEQELLLQNASADTVSSELPPDMEELLDSFLHKARMLTVTEKNIIKYYSEGDDIHAVAEKAFISIHTVRKHNANIYQKLAVGSRDELMLYIELFRRCGRLDELL